MTPCRIATYTVRKTTTLLSKCRDCTSMGAVARGGCSRRSGRNGSPGASLALFSIILCVHGHSVGSQAGSTESVVLRLEAWSPLDGDPELRGREGFKNCRRPGKWNSVPGLPWSWLAPTPKHPASEPLTLPAAWERSQPLAFTCSQIVFKGKQTSAIPSAFFYMVRI